MTTTRRNFIRIAGAAAVVAAGASTTFLLTRDPADARAPWHAAGTTETEPRRRALSYAILAPNPHNRQPWLIDLVGDSDMLVYCDDTRLLPETDPFSRQIMIGLGCFLDLLRMAAAQDGYATETSLFPDGFPADAIDARPVARVRFTESADVAVDPLFAQVLNRRSNKDPYDTARPVDMAILTALRQATGDQSGARIDTTNDPARVEQLRDLTWRAFEMEIRTPPAYLESVELMRIGKREIIANPDGIDLGGPMLETLKLFGMLDREQLADPQSSAFAQGLDMYRDITGTAMAHIWVATPGNARTDQIAAGAAYLRLNLAATGLGLAMHPLSQALQEYSEMTALYEEANAALSTGEGERVQMLARLGYGEAVAPSPRWPVESRIRTA